jgi:hypothetical protein
MEQSPTSVMFSEEIIITPEMAVKPNLNQFIGKAFSAFKEPLT